MGQIVPPQHVLGLVAVTSRHDDALAWAELRFREFWGGLSAVSDRFVFDQTEYYTATMGEGLRKQLFLSNQLVDPAVLSQWKVTTNEWEREYAASRSWPDPRPLNLDPGYLTLDKLVLASTKNHAHRLYLDRGIYAEITLQYRARRWQSLPWTYPDYQQPEYHEVLNRGRESLRNLLARDTSSTPPGSEPGSAAINV